MMKILSSATKIVFLLLATASAVAFLHAVFTGKTVMTTKDFMVLAGMAFGFYFAYKGKEGEPYAGK